MLSFEIDKFAWLYVKTTFGWVFTEAHDRDAMQGVYVESDKEGASDV